MDVWQGRVVLEGDACAPVFLSEACQERFDAPVILICDSLSLQQALSLQNVAAVVTREGAPNGHVAVALRSAGIPWVCGIVPHKSWQGRMALLEDGRLFLDPDPEAVRRYKEKAAQRQERLKRLLSESKRPLQNALGQAIQIMAAVNGLAQADEAIQNGAEGIGLLRSECLYCKMKEAPDEETQYWAYRTLLSRSGGRPCVVRALDVSADKPLPFLSETGGARGVQCLLKHSQLFRTQLCALLRASAHGPLGILLPFVQSLDEWHACRALIAEYRLELSGRDVPMGALSLGAMLETPQAASLCGALAKEADFLCIGSGDLIAHALSVSREDARYAPDPSGVHALLRQLSKEADAEGCPISLCGVLADFPALAADALSLGIRRFVVSPARIPWVREALQAALTAPSLA